MLPYILPTDQRLMLLEWLFEQVEPGVFQSNDFISSELEKYKRLALLCKQYGIRPLGKHTLEDSIQGTNGAFEAIEFLWEVIDFARQLILFDNLQNPQIKVTNNVKLVNFITQSSSKIFTDHVRLFSPGFPKLDDNDHELQSKLEVARDELKEHLNIFRQE